MDGDSVNQVLRFGLWKNLAVRNMSMPAAALVTTDAWCKRRAFQISIPMPPWMHSRPFCQAHVAFAKFTAGIREYDLVWLAVFPDVGEVAGFFYAADMAAKMLHFDHRDPQKQKARSSIWRAGIISE